MVRNKNIYSDLTEENKSIGIEAWQSNVYPQFLERKGKKARRLIIGQSDPRIYFRVDKAYIPSDAERQTAALEIEYFDEGVGHFTVLYKSKGEKVCLEPVLLDNTKIWRGKTFYLVNPELDRSIEANDFCIELNPTGFDRSPCGGIFSYARLSFEGVSGKAISIKTKALCGNTFLSKDDVRFYISVENADEEYEADIVIENDLGEEILCEHTCITGGEYEYAPRIERFGRYLIRVSCMGKHSGEFSYNEAKLALSLDAGKKKNNFLGGCVHLTYRDSAAVIPLMRASGFGAIRDGFDWELYEKEEGVFKFLPEWERYISDTKNGGLEIFTVLGLINPVYHKNGACVPKTPKETEAFKRYVFNTVKALGDRCNMYEVWNEPNLKSFSTDISPEAYVPALKAGYESVKEANPNAYVVGCGTSGEARPWIERVLQLGGGEYMDAVSFHPYLWVKGPDDGEFEEKLSGLAKIIERYCPKLDMVISEFGWASHSMADITLKLHAEFFVKSLAIASAQKRLKKYFYYEYQDSGMSFTHVERNFGFVEYWENHTPYAAKPIFTASAAYNSFIGDKRPEWSVKIDGVFGFSYSTDDGYILMTWAKDSTEISIKPSAAAVYDINGNSLPMSKGYSLSESPIYIKSEKELTEGEFKEMIRGRSR